MHNRGMEPNDNQFNNPNKSYPQKCSACGDRVGWDHIRVTGGNQTHLYHNNGVCKPEGIKPKQQGIQEPDSSRPKINPDVPREPNFDDRHQGNTYTPKPKPKNPKDLIGPRPNIDDYPKEKDRSSDKGKKDQYKPKPKPKDLIGPRPGPRPNIDDYPKEKDRSSDKGKKDQYTPKPKRPLDENPHDTKFNPPYPPNKDDNDKGYRSKKPKPPKTPPSTGGVAKPLPKEERTYGGVKGLKPKPLGPAKRKPGFSK